MNASFTLQVEQSLRNLGFTRHEIQALIYLIRVKNSTSRKLSRETAIPYSMTKAVLANLNRRGLISVEKTDEKAIYTFNGKENFQAWLREEQLKHKSIYEQAGEDMEQFFSNTAEQQWQPDVLFYEGKEGLKEMYDDMLKSGEDIYTCTDLEQLIDILGKKYIHNFVKTRKEKNIKLFTIRSSRTDDHFSKQESMAANELREVKIIKDLALNGEIKVYGEKSALVTFEGDRPVGFVFSGGPTARLMKKFFDQLWKNL